MNTTTDLVTLVPGYSTILNGPTEPIETITPDIIELANNMLAFIRSRGGIGLAANQVGVSKSLIVIDLGADEPPLMMVNPHITAYSDEKQTLEEGCLSFPDVLIPVERSTQVRVRYIDENGRPQANVYVGMTARVIQHEVDHLNGITLKSKVSRMKWEQAVRKTRKKR